MRLSIKTAILITLLLGGILRAQQPKNRNFSGTYENKDMAVGLQGAQAEHLTSTVEFHADGTVSYTFLSKRREGSFKLEGEKLIAQIPYEDPLAHEVITRTHVWRKDGKDLLDEVDHRWPPKPLTKAAANDKTSAPGRQIPASTGPPAGTVNDGQTAPKVGDRVAGRMVEGGELLPGTIKEALPKGVFIVEFDLLLPSRSRIPVHTVGNPGKLFLLAPNGEKGRDVADFAEGGAVDNVQPSFPPR